jgi:S1-C subfamily serine protease
MNDLMTIGRPNRPQRPWLGIYATEVDDRVVIAGTAGNGPADRAGIETGDMVLAVAGVAVDSLAGLYRAIWSLGEAGVGVPMTLLRESRTLELKVASGDRNRFLKQPKLH